MSEQQKVFASLSGAFVAHVILFFLVFLLLSTRAVNSSLMGEKNRDQEAPQEVTILMSDLMDQLITEEPPVPQERSFISTDLNRPESHAPENARFESDRNTTAASELQPNETLPGERVPTLEGDNPLPNLTLQNREFVEGRLNELPLEASASPEKISSGGPAAGEAAPSVGDSPESRTGQDPPGNQQAQNSKDEENQEGATDRPKETMDEQRSRPEGLNEAAEIPPPDEPGNGRETTVQRSFIDPSGESDSTVSGPMSGENDRTAARKGEKNGAEAITDPLQEKVRAASPAKAGEVSPEPPSNGKMASKTADDGLFSSGFSPEERQNVINGSLGRVGQNAVDAEETAMGRYKKAVRDAISSTWHRYRQDNADFVTWGILRLEFTVDSKGGVSNLQITKNEANAILAEFSLKAVKEAKIPPMPEDVAKSVGSKGLEIQYDIIIY